MSDRTITMRVLSVQTTEAVIVTTTHGGLHKVARRAIVALLDARDFLAYQLTHAQGGMEDEELNRLAQVYLRRESWDDAVLTTEVSELATLIPDRLDAEVVSTVFACDVEQAARVLTMAVTSASLEAGPVERERHLGE